MIGKRQKQAAHAGFVGEALQFRAAGYCQKLFEPGRGAVRIAKPRRGAQAAPKRKVRVVL